MLKFNYNELTKLYYSIGEVAKMFNVNTSLLRFWEKEFNLKIEKKSENGKRFYSKNEIKYLSEIYVLLKEKNYTIEGAKKILNNIKPKKQLENHSNEEIIEKLEKIKNKLEKFIS